jgi:Na+-driven multidrug efflux pump
VNRQRITLIFYAIGLVINIIFNILVIKLGYGVVGVAWVTVGSQGLMTLAIYYFTRNYMFIDKTDYLKLQARILIPFLVSIFFYFFHEYLGSSAPNKWAFIGISLAAQVILWGLLIGSFYRDYLSIKEIKAVVAQIKDGLRSGKADK